MQIHVLTGHDLELFKYNATFYSICTLLTIIIYDRFYSKLAKPKCIMITKSLDEEDNLLNNQVKWLRCTQTGSQFDSVKHDALALEHNGAFGMSQKFEQTSFLVVTVRYAFSLGLVSRQLGAFSSLPVYEIVTLTFPQLEERVNHVVNR